MQTRRNVKDKETKACTISLPSGLHQEVRKMAFHRDCSMSLIFQEAVAKYVDENKEGEAEDVGSTNAV